MNFTTYTVVLTATKEPKIINGTEKYDSNGKLVTDANAQTASSSATTQDVKSTTKESAPTTNPLFSSFSMIAIWVVMIGVFFYTNNRQAKKRDAEFKKMQESIQVGSDVICTNGFYGKVVDVSSETFIVEFGTNKGLRIPVRKRDVFLASEANTEKK